MVGQPGACGQCVVLTVHIGAAVNALIQCLVMVGMSARGLNWRPATAPVNCVRMVSSCLFLHLWERLRLLLLEM